MTKDSEKLLRDLLKSECDRALENEPWNEFSDGVMREIYATEFEASSLVGDDIADAVVDRDPHFGAFTEQVMHKVRIEERSRARLSLVEQAVVRLRDQVTAEVEAIEPRFEREFFHWVRQRIDAPSRVRQFFDGLFGWLTPTRGATVLAAAVVVTMSVGTQWVDGAPWHDQIAAVSVDALRFEGTVTVLDEPDVTVIWLADS